MLPSPTIVTFRTFTGTDLCSSVETGAFYENINIHLCTHSLKLNVFIDNASFIELVKEASAKLA
jgi:hypothetical protein